LNEGKNKGRGETAENQFTDACVGEKECWAHGGENVPGGQCLGGGGGGGGGVVGGGGGWERLVYGGTPEEKLMK